MHNTLNVRYNNVLLIAANADHGTQAGSYLVVLVHQHHLWNGGTDRGSHAVCDGG